MAKNSAAVKVNEQVSDAVDETLVDTQAVQAEVSTGTALVVASEYEQKFLEVANSQVRQESPFKYIKMVQDNGYSEEVDGEVVEVPFGSFHIQGTKLHANEITFRPILSLNKIVKRETSGQFKVLGETIYFRDWFDGVSRIDTFGGVDCGRLFGKAVKDLSPEQQELERDKAKVYTDVFGLAYVGGSTEGVFVRLRLSGGKSMRWSQATNNKVLNNQPAWTRNFNLKLVLPKNDPLLTPQQRAEARNTSCNLIVTPDMSKILSSDEIKKYGGLLMLWTEQHNDMIKQRHLDALNKRTQAEYADGQVLDGDYIDLDD